MKLSPLFIFLILLVVLVLSVIFSNWLPLSNNREGLITLYNNINVLDKVTIPKYSTTKSVTKLYDSLFFDTSNGNLIEVNGSICLPDSSNPGNIKCTTYDTTLGKIWVIFTDNKTGLKNEKIYENDDENTESKNPYTKVNSFWSYTTNNEQRITPSITDKYQVFYISWDDIKFVHIMNLTTSQNLYSYICLPDTFKYIELKTSFPVTYTITNTIENYDPVQYKRNHPNIKDIFLIENDVVQYDGVNRKIIIKNSNSAKVYKAGIDNAPMTTDDTTTGTDTILEASLRSSMISYKDINNKLKYIVSTIYSKITIIIIIDYKSYEYIIDKVCIFDLDGKLRFNSTGSKLYDITKPAYHRPTDIITYIPTDVTPDVPTDVTPDVPTDYEIHDIDHISNDNTGITDNSGGNYQSDYYKWYWYWKTADYNNNNKSISNDYILKTQVIPPVCPSCPGCSLNNNEICSNCGGNGGSGTIINGLYNVGSGLNKNLNAVGSGLYNAGSGLNNNLNAVGSGLYNAGSGLNNNLNAVGSGLNNNLNAVGSGLNNNLNAVGSGLYNAGSGLNNNLNAVGSALYNSGSRLNNDLNANQPGLIQNQNQNNFGQYNRVGQYNTINPGIDTYSAYGALSSKGGNFIPITNSFSAFGK